MYMQQLGTSAKNGGRPSTSCQSFPCQYFDQEVLMDACEINAESFSSVRYSFSCKQCSFVLHQSVMAFGGSCKFQHKNIMVL